MKYYTSTTQFNCGIDLHARQMYVCVVDRQGTKLLHQNIQDNDFAFFLARRRDRRGVNWIGFWVAPNPRECRRWKAVTAVPVTADGPSEPQRVFSRPRRAELPTEIPRPSAAPGARADPQKSAPGLFFLFTRPGLTGVRPDHGLGNLDSCARAAQSNRPVATAETPLHTRPKSKPNRATSDSR